MFVRERRNVQRSGPQSKEFYLLSVCGGGGTKIKPKLQSGCRQKKKRNAVMTMTTMLVTENKQIFTGTGYDK
jgi:hypothetical protein